MWFLLNTCSFSEWQFVTGKVQTNLWASFLFWFPVCAEVKKKLKLSLKKISLLAFVIEYQADSQVHELSGHFPLLKHKGLCPSIVKMCGPNCLVFQSPEFSEHLIWVRMSDMTLNNLSRSPNVLGGKSLFLLQVHTRPNLEFGTMTAREWKRNLFPSWRFQRNRCGNMKPLRSSWRSSLYSQQPVLSFLAMIFPQVRASFTFAAPEHHCLFLTKFVPWRYKMWASPFIELTVPKDGRDSCSFLYDWQIFKPWISLTASLKLVSLHWHKSKVAKPKLGLGRKTWDPKILRSLNVKQEPCGYSFGRST